MTDPASHEARIKRLRMRSWRRGTREMDLILGPFADQALAALSPERIDLFELLLEENDHDLYLWISTWPQATQAGAKPAPASYVALLEQIVGFVEQRMRSGV